ncbi:hypothetical protein M501DRAFT_902753, partial [Patellaria atrata CBS 101060]
DCCVICLENISERAITVPCNHCTFDFICLASWLQERSLCPLCKTEVIAVQYDWRPPDDYKTYVVKTPLSQTSSTPTRLIRNLNSTCDSRRRPRAHGGRRFHHEPAPTPDVALLQRRHVYSNQLFSLHIGNNRLSRFQNVTPSIFVTSPELQSRARSWIRRELRVFNYLDRSTSNAEFLLEYIIAILKTVDLKGGQAEEMLAEFFARENARLFLHELSAWLRSPYRHIQDWDRNVQYRENL